MTKKFWYMVIPVDKELTVVFDLDDTLYNEFAYLRSAYGEIAAQLAPEDPNGLLAFMISGYREGRNVFKIVSERHNVTVADLVDTYRNHIPDISFFDGVDKLLDTIVKHNGRLAILTDGREMTQMNKVSALGLEKWIERVFVSEVLGSEKPNQNNFKAVEQFFGTQSYIYIADNIKKDFITPKARGWKTVGLIDNGLNIHYTSDFFSREEYLPHRFVSSLAAISITGK